MPHHGNENKEKILQFISTTTMMTTMMMWCRTINFIHIYLHTFTQKKNRTNSFPVIFHQSMFNRICNENLYVTPHNCVNSHLCLPTSRNGYLSVLCESIFLIVWSMKIALKFILFSWEYFKLIMRACICSLFGKFENWCNLL
jgi:hypothetical protein